MNVAVLCRSSASSLSAANEAESSRGKGRASAGDRPDRLSRARRSPSCSSISKPRKNRVRNQSESAIWARALASVRRAASRTASSAAQAPVLGRRRRRRSPPPISSTRSVSHQPSRLGVQRPSPAQATVIWRAKMASSVGSERGAGTASSAYAHPLPAIKRADHHSTRGDALKANAPRFKGTFQSEQRPRCCSAAPQSLQSQIGRAPRRRDAWLLSADV